MLIPSRTLLLAGAAACMAFSLPACRDAETAKLAEQDDGLAANDPAVKGALGSTIMVDPELTGGSNAASATSGARPVDGGVPSVKGGGVPAEAVADARRVAGGTLMRVPAAGRWEEGCEGSCAPAAAARPATLGGLARAQAGEGCAANIEYGAGWATRLPAAFPVYPRAALVEAAGVANARCNVRVVNFQSRAGLQAVLDFYYTQARRNGYSAEHLLRGSEHLLGGTKGDLAFVVMARPLRGGLVDVDLIASGGR